MEGANDFYENVQEMRIVQLRLFPATVMIHCHLNTLEYN